MSLRIIAGSLKGRRLHSVPGLETRPTGDRIREAIFNIVGPALAGATVLDLFAGTGAVGIEAISRGAGFGVFIENNRKALEALHRNIQACGLGERTRIIRWDASRNLNCLESEGMKFDWVYMDPPYAAHLVQPALAHLLDAGCLASGAGIVVEQDARAEPAGTTPPYRLQDRRRYGKTVVSFLRYML
jgi:16S rRNA (guanine(966)-N(2))-methyltransferase RsmD